MTFESIIRFKLVRGSIPAAMTPDMIEVQSISVPCLPCGRRLRDRNA